MRGRNSAIVAAASTAVLSLAGSAFASGVSLSQTFASQPGNWTAVTSNGGTVSFSDAQLDASIYAPTNNTIVVSAYETTATSPMTYTTSASGSSGTIYSSFQVFFNTTNTAYQTTGLHGSADQGASFEIFGGGNNPLANIGFSANAFFGAPEWVPSVSAGIDYGGQTIVSSTNSSQNFTNSGSTKFDGNTFTVNVATTVTNNGIDPNNPADYMWSITDNVTMTGATTSWVGSITVAEDEGITSGYNPLTSNLIFDLGGESVSDGINSATGVTGTVTGDLEFSNLNVSQPAPEPMTFSLLGMGAIGGLLRRRRRTRLGRNSAYEAAADQFTVAAQRTTLANADGQLPHLHHQTTFLTDNVRVVAFSGGGVKYSGPSSDRGWRCPAP